MQVNQGLPDLNNVEKNSLLIKKASYMENGKQKVKLSINKIRLNYLIQKVIEIKAYKKYKHKELGTNHYKLNIVILLGHQWLQKDRKCSYSDKDKRIQTKFFF